MQTSIDHSELVSNITLLLSKYQLGDELEIRFGYYDNEYFRSSISYQTYNKLLTIFSNDNNYTSSFISNIIHMYSNGIRQIRTDNDTIIIKKNKKTRVDNHKLGVRIALSNEKKLTELPSGKYMRKTRHRHTFVHKSNKYIIDLTIDTLPNSNQCQCEIEFLEIPDIVDIINMINMINDIME